MRPVSGDVSESCRVVRSVVKEFDDGETTWEVERACGSIVHGMGETDMHRAMTQCTNARGNECRATPHH